MTPARKTFLKGCLCGGLLTILLAGGGFVAGVFLFREAFVTYQRTQLKPPPVPFGMKADFGWTLLDQDEKRVPADTFQGRPLFLHFWHPECTVCAAETEALNVLWARLERAGVAMACVTWCGAQELREAVERREILYPVYRLEGARPEVFQSKDTPSTFVVAPNGDVVFKHMGGARWDTEAVANFLLQWSGPVPAAEPQSGQPQ